MPGENARRDLAALFGRFHGEIQGDEIRVRQPEVGGSVRLVDGEGNELETRFGQPVAHAGDKVYVEVDLEEGYRVGGVFVGEDDIEELASDEGGNYLIVPEGGGVTVSVSLEG